MKEEIQGAISSAENLGSDIERMANITPDVLANAITFAASLVRIPWAMVANTSGVAAIKIDEATDMVV